MEATQVQNLKAGNQIAENNGLMWDVIAVEKISKQFYNITIACDFSNFREHWKSNGGKVVKMNGKTLVMAV